MRGDLSSTVSDGSSTLSNAVGSVSEGATLLGGSGGSNEEDSKDEDWVAVQRKKKSSSHIDGKVRGSSRAHLEV